jgi:geranylgeranyl diphosphate synthase type I
MLEEHNLSQADMMSENCILVDSDDHAIGSASKMECHIGDGKRHRAFSVLLFDSNDRLLLQRRSLDKITFPGIWANSCCSHPLDIDGENGDAVAGVISAAKRKLDQELGIPLSVTSEWDFIHIGSFEYRCRWDENWIEHEIDHVLVVKADVEVVPNPNEIAEVQWVEVELLNQIMRGFEWEDRVIAPWFRHIHTLFYHRWLRALTGREYLEHSDILAEIDRGGVLKIKHPRRRPSPTDIPGQSLLDALSSHRDIVEGVIMTSLGKMKQERLHGAMTHLFTGGGKRLRAILPRLVGEATGEAHEGHYTLGACIEIIHNFTLVHDDIMDQDPIRRGLDAVHVAYDDATAINAGDAMLAVGFEILAESPHIEPENLAFLVSSIGEMVRKVAEGQMVDIEFENRDDVTEDDYIAMITGKTSAMFETCAMTGAKLAGADDEAVKNMAEWGLNLGLCFQLMDDLIDITGDTRTLGKPAGSDIVQGKRTLIAIHALGCDFELPMFSKVFGTGECSDDDLAQAVVELHACGSIDYAKERAMHHHSLAHKCLDELVDSSAVSVLRELTDFQLIRIN